MAQVDLLEIAQVINLSFNNSLQRTLPDFNKYKNIFSNKQ